MSAETWIIDDRITTYGRLFEAHTRLHHLLGKELEEAVGLPLSWYGVLLHVGRSPDGTRPMNELINATAFTSGGVTRLVDRMEHAGLVKRRPCATDRRVQYVALTESGWDILRRATEIHVQGIDRHMIGHLEPEEVQQLDRLLARVLDSGDRER